MPFGTSGEDGLILHRKQIACAAMFGSVRGVAVGMIFSVALAAAACTTQKAARPAVDPPQSEMTTQPAAATYSCADGSLITIQNLGASVRISGVSDSPIELPAAPATQRSRYGEQPYALVLDGNDALFMKTGSQPLTCTR
jgi:hypothetical protein